MEDTDNGHRVTFTFYDGLYRAVLSIQMMSPPQGGMELGQLQIPLPGGGVEVVDMVLDEVGGVIVPPAIVVPQKAAFYPAVEEGRPRDIVTRTYYDKSDNVIRTVDPEGNDSLNAYDGLGRLTLTMGAQTPSGRPTTFVLYDPNGNRILTTGANGTNIWMYYDARNRMVRSIVDLNGDHVPTWLPPPQRGSGPDAVTDFCHDLVGNVIYQVDPRGALTVNDYDPAGRLVQTTGPAPEEGAPNPVMITSYDPNSNVIAVQDPEGNVTVIAYDPMNRPVMVAGAAGTVTETEYSAFGDVTCQALNGMQRTKYTYDNYGRQTRQQFPDGGTIKTVYTQSGLVRHTVNQRGAVTTNFHDLAGRVVESIHTGGILPETRRFTYDLAGNVLSVTEVAGSRLKGRTRYEYDGLYRVIQETRLDPDAPGVGEYWVDSRYDSKGNRTYVNQPTGECGPDGKETRRELIYRYDRQDRMLSGGGAGYTYDVNGNRLSCFYPNGLRHEYTYDYLNRVKTCATFDPGDPANPVYACIYTYDLVGNRLFIDETTARPGDASPVHRNLAYLYDAEYRLTREQWTGENCDPATYVYTYDRHGNRTRMTKNGVTTSYSYNQRTNALRSHITEGVRTSYQYDIAGNRISKSKAAGGGTGAAEDTRYWYDGFNRLGAVTMKKGDNPTETVFKAEYDYRTRRTWKYEKGSGWTCFRYDGGVSFDEWKVNESAEWEQQVWFSRGAGMGGGIGSIIYSDRSASVGEPTQDDIDRQAWLEERIAVRTDQRDRLAEKIESKRGKVPAHVIEKWEEQLAVLDAEIDGYQAELGGLDVKYEPLEYFVYNAVGHTVATVTATREVKSSNIYEAFGSILYRTGESENNRLANTKERDFSIGLDNHGMRYYDPEIGRYVTRDPAGYVDEMNAYLYVRNNPINHIDPLGLENARAKELEELRKQAVDHRKRYGELIAEYRKYPWGDPRKKRIRDQMGQVVVAYATTVLKMSDTGKRILEAVKGKVTVRAVWKGSSGYAPADKRIDIRVSTTDDYALEKSVESLAHEGGHAFSDVVGYTYGGEKWRWPDIEKYQGRREKWVKHMMREEGEAEYTRYVIWKEFTASKQAKGLVREAHLWKESGIYMKRWTRWEEELPPAAARKRTVMDWAQRVAPHREAGEVRRKKLRYPAWFRYKWQRRWEREEEQ